MVPRTKTPKRYPFLEELRDTAVDQISIEAAQPKLDLSVLGRMGDKTIMLGVIDLGSDEVESVRRSLRTAFGLPCSTSHPSGWCSRQTAA